MGKFYDQKKSEAERYLSVKNNRQFSVVERELNNNLNEWNLLNY